MKKITLKRVIVQREKQHYQTYQTFSKQAEVLTSICIKNVKDAERAAEELLSRGCGSVIITLGGEGALYSTSQGHMHVSAEKVTPVDTTVSIIFSFTWHFF